MRVSPQDDYPHPVGPERNFNESMYFQFHDPIAGIGGFLRLAKRPNEGRGERTVCLYLPDGSVAFGYARPHLDSAGPFRGAGMAVEVVEPFELLRVSFEGTVSVLADPAALADPKKALSGAPVSRLSATLQFRGVAPPYAENFDGDGESFAPHHYEQLIRASGQLALGDAGIDAGIDAEIEVAGFGLRDHSWGPRSWQAPHFYRWVHGSADGRGFMGAYFGEPQGTDRTGGFVWDGGQLHVCDTVAISTERDDGAQPRAVTVTLADQRTNPQRRWVFRGEVGVVVPLRHRRSDPGNGGPRNGDSGNGDSGNEDATRIAEAATVWTAQDGIVLYGMSEYLDQVRGGQLAGLRV